MPSSITFEEEFPLWRTVEYPYHLKPNLPEDPSQKDPSQEDPSHCKSKDKAEPRSHEAKVMATLLAIPLAIVREELR